MSRLCFFASYYQGDELPYYCKVYLKELKKQVDRVVLLGTTRLSVADIHFLSQENIEHCVYKNEGYDFGLWFTAIQEFKVGDYNELWLVNDSAVLFGPLAPFTRWVEGQKSELLGMTRSEAVSPHIQSYFLILKGKAKELSISYFRQHGLLPELQQVIKTYEIGLSSHLSKQGIEMASFVDNKGYAGEFSPYYYYLEHHLSKGLPLIKKKVLFVSYRKDEMLTLARMGFNIDPAHYFQLIATNHKDIIIDLNRLRSENKPKMGAFDRMSYHITKLFFSIARPIYKQFKRVS